MMFDRNVFLSATILCALGCLVGAMVIGPSNRNSYPTTMCAERYAAARTANDSSRVDSLVLMRGGSGFSTCGMTRIKRVPLGTGGLAGAISN